MTVKMKAREIKGLLIADNPVDAKAVQDMLAQSGDARLKLTWVDRLEAGLDQLGKGNIDVVVLSLALSNIQWSDMLTTLQAQSPEVPIVILSSLQDQSCALSTVVPAGDGVSAERGAEAGSTRITVISCQPPGERSGREP